MFIQYCYACKTFATEFDGMCKQYDWVKALMTMLHTTVP